MLRTVSHPLFFLPAMLLLVMMGLTAVTEYKIEDYSESIVFVLNDKIPQLNDELYNSLLSTKKSLMTYTAHDGNSPDNLENLKRLGNVSREKFSNLEQYFYQHPEEIKEHLSGTIQISELSKDSVALAEAINFIADSKDAQQKASETLDSFIEKTRGLIFETAELHNNETQHLLNIISHKDSQRLAFLILTWLSSIILALFLFHNAVVYRRKCDTAIRTEKNNEIFAAALQSARVGIMIRDLVQPDMPIIFINRAFAAITGYNFEDVNGKPPYFLFGLHTSQDIAREMRLAFFERRAFTSDVLLYRKDNTPFWGEWNTSPITDKDGQATHLISLIIDISAIRSTQEALQLAKEEAEKAISVKGHFLAAMSHELRTPINGMLGVLELLSDMTLDGEQMKLVQVAKTSGKRLLEIVNDILDYSKIEAGKFEVEISPFSLRQMIKEALDLMQPIASAKKIPIKCSITADTPDIIQSDGGRIRQVLLNLLSNAIKFTEQGSVELKIFCLLDRSGSEQKSSLIRFEVIDTGLGISIADQEKLFTEFTQVERSFVRRFGGTGLGLAISKQLVKLLNGEIGVESRPGNGSKFWFMLPLETANTDNLETPASQQQAIPAFSDMPVKPNAYVLLVEDNQVNQLVANRYLQKAGCIVDIANNGVEAIQKVELNKYDMIFMDVSMPEMDGLEATKRIRLKGDMFSIIPIIALTAHAMRGDREQCIAAGMNDYLSKPLSFDTLKAALIKWLPHNYPGKEPALTPLPNIETIVPEESLPVLDPSALSNLVKDLDVETMLRICHVFLEDMEMRFNKLEETITREANTEIAEAAHALKSSSANCGLALFSDVMKQIEIAGNTNDLERIKEIAKDLRAHYTSARAALSEELKKYDK